MGDRPAVIDVRDLEARYAWNPLAITSFVAAAGLDVEPGASFQQFGPPRVLVLISPFERAWRVRNARLWLAGCERIVLLRELRDTSDRDPEADESWSSVLAGLPVEVLDTRRGDRGMAHEALRRALAACAVLAPPLAAPRVSMASRELPVSPWCAYTIQTPGPMLALANFTPRLRDGFLHGAVGAAPVDLADIPAVVALRDLPRARDEAIPHRRGYLAVGRDPTYPVGWRGDRMFFYWFFCAGTEEGFLSAADHDFPCGPAKKLWGFKDNDPVQILLAPDASLCAARFDHDVLVTSAVPIPWSRAGEVDVAVFPRDPQRAVFFAQDASDPGCTRNESTDLLDDDARDVAPILVLGPGGYAVDLSLPVYRITRVNDERARADHVGGPDEGFAVFDTDHRLLRRGSGRLIGGWYRWATVEENGHYWREDLATGERTHVAPVDLAVAEDPDLESVARDAILDGRAEAALAIHAAHPVRSVVVGGVGAVSIPGTRNVLLLTATHLRVI